MSKVRRWFEGRRSDERGATFIFTAICMVMLLWAGALGVDVGFSVWGSRTAQAMADTGSLDLAQYINIADQITTAQGGNPAVQTYLNGKLAGVETDNGSNAVMTVTPGLWSGGTFQDAGQCAYTTPLLHAQCNAVEVTANQSVPQIFRGGFNVLTAHASNSIAALTPEAGFSIGTYLASMSSTQSAVLNSILGTLGTSVNLTAVGYQGLATTYVTAGQLITASGGLLSPTTIMTASLSAAQWLAIWQDAVGTQEASLSCGASPEPSACVADTALGALSFANTDSVQLCNLVTINGSSCGSGSLTTQGLKANLDVLQTLTTEAEVANGTNAINLGTGLGITGVGSASLQLTIGSLPAVRYGPVGTSATTGQVTADLQLNLPLLGGLLNIPVSAASGTATLQQVNCDDNTLQNTKINASTTSTTAAVTLAGVSLTSLSISGQSTVNLGYLPANVPPTASTASADTNPQSLGSSSPTITETPTIGALNPLYTVFSAITSVLAPVLQAAGVTVGGAEVANLSNTCDAVSLVQ